MNKMTASLEDYLEAVFVLGQNGSAVRVTDLAQNLRVSKPSVNHAVKQLCEKRLAEHEAYGAITLTAAGETYAANVLRRHKMIKAFLISSLGVSEENAEADACRMEHVMSGETVDKLYEYLEKQVQA